jgi:hypothetical protein
VRREGVEANTSPLRRNSAARDLFTPRKTGHS